MTTTSRLLGSNGWLLILLSGLVFLVGSRSYGTSSAEPVSYDQRLYGSGLTILFDRPDVSASIVVAESPNPHDAFEILLEVDRSTLKGSTNVAFLTSDDVLFVRQDPRNPEHATLLQSDGKGAIGANNGDYRSGELLSANINPDSPSIVWFDNYEIPHDAYTWGLAVNPEDVNLKVAIRHLQPASFYRSEAQYDFVSIPFVGSLGEFLINSQDGSVILERELFGKSLWFVSPMGVTVKGRWMYGDQLLDRSDPWPLASTGDDMLWRFDESQEVHYRIRDLAFEKQLADSTSRRLFMSGVFFGGSIGMATAGLQMVLSRR